MAYHPRPPRRDHSPDPYRDNRDRDDRDYPRHPREIPPRAHGHHRRDYPEHPRDSHNDVRRPRDYNPRDSSPHLRDRDYTPPYHREREYTPPRRPRDYDPEYENDYEQDYDDDYNQDYDQDYDYDDYYDHDHDHDYDYDSEPRRPPRRSFKHDRDYHDSDRDDSERRPTTPPSHSIVFLGLPPYVDEELFQRWLEGIGAVVETTTIVRDRQTNQSKRFGFARFASVQHATNFLEPNFPFVSWDSEVAGGDTQDTGLQVRIDYSSRSQNQQQSQPSRSASSKGPRADKRPTNDGTRDIGTSPHRTILIRNIDLEASEEDIYAALDRIPNSDRTKPLYIYIIKGRHDSRSWGFAFVQFVNAQAATNLFAKVMDPKTIPEGFRILGTPVAVSFAQPDSFLLAPTPSPWSFPIQEGPENNVVHYTYWDKDGFAELWTAPDAEKTIAQLSTPQSQPPSQQTSQAPQIPPTASHSVQDPSKTSEKKKKSSASASASADSIVGKKIAVNIKAWDKKKQELSHDNEKDKDKHSVEMSTKEEKIDNNTFDAPGMEFADPTRKSCLLCMRQFGSFEEIKRHNDLSSLHKGNLEKEDVKQAALEKKKKSMESNLENPANASSTSVKDNTPKYRDRALERRIALGQPDQPTRTAGGDGNDEHVTKKQKKSAAGPEPVLKPEITSTADKPIEESNIGSKMLEAMGYKKGESLGLSQEGIVNPVTAQVYAQGTGIGSSKGVAVGSQQESFSKPSEYNRERARQRAQEEEPSSSR